MTGLSRCGRQYPESLWDDIGPNSQGEILTAILKRDDAAALRMLGGWSGPDLTALNNAANRLVVLIQKERARRR